MSSRFSKLELPDAPALDTGPAAPQGAARHLSLGDNARVRGDHEAALRYYARALDEDANLASAWLGQVQCLLELGELDEAVAWADRALTLHPTSGDLFAAKAVAFGRKGDLERAMALSDGALKQAQVGPFVWWARGDVLLSSNRRTAEHCFQKAGDDPLIALAIGRSYLSVDSPGAARPWFQRAAERLPDNPQAWHYVGVASAELGLTDAARGAFREALRIRPGFRASREALDRLGHAGPWARLSAWLRRRR